MYDGTQPVPSGTKTQLNITNEVVVHVYGVPLAYLKGQTGSRISKINKEMHMVPYNQLIRISLG